MGDIEHGTSEGPHVEMIQKYERNTGSMTRKAQVFGMGQRGVMQLRANGE